MDPQPDEIPFSKYAAVYDLIYQDKDYAAEAAFVSELIRRNVTRSAHAPKVIDLACGTGRHVIELSRLGFDVEGSDISAGMVGVARETVAALRLPISFHNQPFQTADSIPGRFDVALAMFASVGYLTSWNDFARAITSVRRLLVPGGLFLFDVWNGLAVMRDYSPTRTKRVRGNGLQVERVSRTTLNEIAQIAQISFDFTVTSDESGVTSFSETHAVRYYFPRELTDILSALNFSVIACCPFLEPDRDLLATDWNMTLVARCNP